MVHPGPDLTTARGDGRYARVKEQDN
jgi:hypothetical protein